MKICYEQGRLHEKWIARYCRGNWKNCVRYHMEDRGEYHPDWMLPDGSMDMNLKAFWNGRVDSREKE